MKMKSAQAGLWFICFGIQLVGCGGPGGTNQGMTSTDMAGGGGDGATASDMAMSLAEDMAKPLGGSANSGDPCVKDGDCAIGLGKSQPGICQMMSTFSMAKITWPLGYCTSACRMSNNDMTSGTNMDCPGGSGTCTNDVAGNTAVGHCRAQCVMSTDCRADYACWYVVGDVSTGCEPKSESQCDPTKAASCPGVPDADGGASPQTCTNFFSAGNDVGLCVAACNLFTVMGCPANNADQGDCHASYLTGEGECDYSNTMPAKAGEACMFDNDCVPGYGCLGGLCFKYCHNDGKTVAAQCGKMGATCAPLEKSMVPAALAGICSTSI